MSDCKKLNYTDGITFGVERYDKIEHHVPNSDATHIILQYANPLCNFCGFRSCPSSCSEKKEFWNIKYGVCVQMCSQCTVYSLHVFQDDGKWGPPGVNIMRDRLRFIIPRFPTLIRFLQTMALTKRLPLELSPSELINHSLVFDKAVNAFDQERLSDISKFLNTIEATGRHIRG